MRNRLDRIESSEQRDINSLIGDGKLALGCLFGTLFCLGVWALFGSLIEELSSEHLTQFVPSVVALLVAGVSALISFNAYIEQKRARQAGTDPVILVHLGKRADAPMLSTLEIENVGAGAALDVHVVFDTDISEFVPERIITDFNAVLHPIRAIPSGTSKSFNFGMGYKLLGDDPVPLISITVTYEDIEGGRYRSNQTIDVRELKAQSASKAPPALIAAHLNEISKNVKELARQTHEFRVISQDIEAHRTEEKLMYDEMKAELEAAKQKDQS